VRNWKNYIGCFSPRLKKNIALAMVNIKYAKKGTKLQVKIEDKIVNCTIVDKPFFDPKKKIASSKIRK